MQNFRFFRKIFLKSFLCLKRLRNFLKRSDRNFPIFKTQKTRKNDKKKVKKVQKRGVFCKKIKRKIELDSRLVFSKKFWTPFGGFLTRPKLDPPPSIPRNHGPKIRPPIHPTHPNISCAHVVRTPRDLSRDP